MKNSRSRSRSLGSNLFPPWSSPAMHVPLSLLLSLMPLTAADETPTYERDVRPLLARRCLVCHNEKKREKLDVSAGLALDTFDAAMIGTKDHKIIQPGKASESSLYTRLIDEDEERRMPYLEEPLPDSEKELIRRWIEVGAPRGEPTERPSSEPMRSSARQVLRTLDVIFPTDLRVPKGVDGLGEGGPVQLALKVGPIPAITALAFRADGRILAVGTLGRVVLWDLSENTAAASLEDIPGSAHALAFSPDGRRLAVGAGLAARSGSVRVYSVPDGTLIHDLPGHTDSVYSLAFSPDGSRLASAGFDQTIRIWNLLSGKAEGQSKGHSDFVYEVAFATDGQTILSASKDRSVKRFKAATLEGVRTYSDHNDDVLALAVRPDGSGFVSAGNEPQIRWWESNGEKPVKRVGGHSGPVFELAFSGNGKRLISASGDKSVRLWDGSSGVFQRTLPGPTEWQYAVALSDDATLAAAGGWDGLVRVWDAEKGTLRVTLIQPPCQSPGHSSWLALTPLGEISASDDLKSLVHWRVGGNEVAAEAVATWMANTKK